MPSFSAVLQQVRPFEGHLFQQLWIVGHRGPVRLPLPQPCLRPVQGDAPEPRAELAAVTQIGQLLERLDEDVLYEILDFAGRRTLFRMIPWTRPR